MRVLSSSFLSLFSLCLFLSSLTWAQSERETESSSPYLCNIAPEPTFGEILSYLFPVSLSSFSPPISSSSSSSSSSSNSIPKALLNVSSSLFFQFSELFSSTKFPLAYLLSDGVFNVTMEQREDYRYFTEVVLLKQKHWLQRYLCQFAPSLFKSVCGCWSGVSLIDYYGASNAKFILPEKSEEDWCVFANPCSGQPVESHDQLCQIYVDPLTTSCLAARSPFRELNDVSYHLEVQTLGSSHGWNRDILSSLHSLCEWISGSSTNQLCQTFQHFLEKFLKVLSSWIPRYLLNTLVAVLLLSVEDSVASHPLVRFTLAIIIGLFLALLWVVIVIYRIGKNFLKTDGIPIIGSFIQPSLTAAFLGFSVFFTSESVQRYLLEKLIEFWDHGAFGFSWLGKLYFLTSIGLSLFVTYRYGFFEEGSLSHTFLRLLLRSLGGALLFLRCSPNPDVCFILGVAALLRDSIMTLSHEMWITLEASRQVPTIRYSGQQPLTMDEYHLQGEIHTTAALENLQRYLQTPQGKAELSRITWRLREVSRDDLSIRLEQFAKGKYGGRPKQDESDDEFDDEEETTLDPPSSKRTWAKACLTMTLYLVICLFLSGAVAFIVSDAKSDFPENGFFSKVHGFFQQIGVLRSSMGANTEF